MPGSHSPVDGKRFIGEKKTKIFHDSFLGASAAGLDGCKTDGLPPEDIQTFDPDTPLEAILKGFAPCTKCLWAKQHRHE